jgi:2-polyprenyl-3-methyl-5-hydroxy-6-metoxy-1,4-benzoquinol methylase
MPRPVTTRAFDVAYEGIPSWETGRPQPVVARLVSMGEIRGAVLDVGCGTGLHAVLLASQGHRVAGIDLAVRAVALARARADAARVAATFVAGDALDLAARAAPLGAPFDSVLDVGLFHVLQPADRRRYAASLASVVRPGGAGFVVAWSDRNPFGIGPARVTRRELRSAFCATEGWRVRAIEPAELETLLPMGRVHAWLVRLERV